MKKNKTFKLIAACLSVFVILCSVTAITYIFGTNSVFSASHCDVTRDGIINGKDIIRIMKYINTDDYYFPEKADVNGDGVIDSDDIAEVYSYYGQTCEILFDPVIEVIPPETEPEETTPSETEPEETTPPETEPEGIDHSKYTYEDYISMTPQEQTEFIKSFPSVSKFMEWYNAAKAKYDKDNGNIDIGDDNIDLGDIFGN